ncbi:hypothetical protein [Alloalcanivorax venustensis]|jgi:hypothetical protein|uniref:Uncharacterized protein n=1 Tax=Alloalcanivorax venustensis ISO4 TaxID=1177184 RepID=A0ABS0AJS3_9GAMM|nr:hypothetical protein [Alloalcanivorax venustensis]KXJ46374.1 MAG: hypothetical protein AXW13_02855 [Alcanivorax sp. Nap_24]MAQ33643.1 hypothetical protein [Alcanivorax sp.]MCH9784518.1 hypothetical protein [Gammaproteobacteria bacterium]MEC8879618.1 hypothetical protein [Pseudomonadota bacterium]MBF47644.1 hypothetical protein [Alcanivorax sp.]|tara:strand:+ start:37739 stop:37993 length:255 start_codon:yes stop_codon:yes gene_type:complete
MPYHEVEETLARALTYLRLSGIRVTPEVARRALRLVDSALEEGEQRLLARVMERLPDTFPLPEEALPPQTPPLHHASVHYADSL